MSIKLLVQNREISKPLFFMMDTAFVHCSDAAKQSFVRFTGAIKTVYRTLKTLYFLQRMRLY